MAYSLRIGDPLPLPDDDRKTCEECGSERAHRGWHKHSRCSKLSGSHTQCFVLHVDVSDGHVKRCEGRRTHDVHHTLGVGGRHHYEARPDPEAGLFCASCAKNLVFSLRLRISAAHKRAA